MAKTALPQAEANGCAKMGCRTAHGRGSHFPVQIFIGDKNKSRISEKGWANKQETAEKRGWTKEKSREHAREHAREMQESNSLTCTPTLVPRDLLIFLFRSGVRIVRGRISRSPGCSSENKERHLLTSRGLASFYKLVVVYAQLLYLYHLSTTFYNLVSAVLWFQHIIG